MRPDKIRRNAIIGAVESGGLDPRDCNFDFGDPDTRITHLPSDSYFLLKGRTGGPYDSIGVVGDGPEWPAKYYGWELMQQRIERWARDVKRDAEVPDRWAELQREREILTSGIYEDVEDAPFTPEEQTDLATLLRTVEAYAAKTYALSEAQTELIQTGFSEITAAARNSDRKHVRLVLLGFMFEVLAKDALPRETVWAILRMTLHGMDHLLGGGGGMMPELPPLV